MLQNTINIEMSKILLPKKETLTSHFYMILLKLLFETDSCGWQIIRINDLGFLF